MNDVTDCFRLRELSGLVMEASGSDSLDTARGDIEEGRERERTYVKGETMHGDPFAYANPDTRDFSIIHPCSGEAFPGVGHDAEVGQGVDQNFLEESKVGMEVPSVVPEIEDGITDELPRSMVGSLPSTVDLKYGVGQVGRLSQAALVTGSSDSVNWRVLHQEKSLGDIA